MISNKENLTFHKYFEEWIEIYKKDSIRLVTYQKYLLTLKRLTEIAPNLKLYELNKRTYQTIINEYAKTHEKQTTMDFHNHLKSAILDAIDDGVISLNPTRKAIIKGKTPKNKKPQFLSQYELQALLKNLNLLEEANWDWFILLVAKTGLRFSEALALCPKDFDFIEHRIKITKTWNYKSSIGGFSETKNISSKRSVSIDPNLNKQFLYLTKDMREDKPIFVNGRIFNSTVNAYLDSLCNKAGIPSICIHSLRHTHASLLIYAGVSIASIAKRLGHSSVTTTQETYLHIIQELENQDNDKIVKHLASLI